MTKSLTFRMTLVFIGCIHGSFVQAQDIPTDLTKFETGTAKERMALIKSWTAAIQKADGLSEKTFSRAKDLIANIDLNANPSLADVAVDFFLVAQQKGFPECERLCMLLLTNKSERADSFRSLGYKMIKSLKIRSADAVDFLLKQSDADALAAEHLKLIADVPSVRQRALVWLRARDAKHSALAVTILTSMVEKPEDLRDATNEILSILIDGPVALHSLVEQYIVEVYRADAFLTHRGALSEDQTKKLFSLIKGNNDQRVKLNAAILLLMNAPVIDEALATFLFDEFKAADAKSGRILLALGFAPRKLGDDELQKLLHESVVKHRGDAAVGPLSLYLRNGTSTAGLSTLITQNKWMPPGSYVSMLTGSKAVRAVPSPEWKTLWEKYAPKDKWPEGRHLVLHQVELAPMAPEAVWVIENALSVEKLRGQGGYLLETMWRIRSRIVSFAEIKGLSDWLEESSRGDSEDAVLAAMLLARINRENIPKVHVAIEKFTKSQPDAFNVWNRIIEGICELDPTSPLLEKWKQQLTYPYSKVSKSVVSDWFCWLIDLRSGKKVGPPPIDSLGFALVVPCGKWTDALSNAGEAGQEWVTALRSNQLVPFVFAARSTETHAQFLGAIDRLEFARRAKK